MARKIYDVVPPKVANKLENTVRDLGVAKAKKKKRTTKSVKITKSPRVEINSQMPAPDQKPSIKKWVGIGVVVCVFLVGLFLFVRLPKAEIQISPTLSEIKLEDEILANKNVSEINFIGKVIPLKVLEDTKESSQNFPATGTASNEGRATGTIRIYNKNNPATPVTLVSGTHFLSDSGKYFVTLAKVTIPAMKNKVPGSIVVKVQAEKSGEEYNIKPASFSVPKLSGTSYYYSIWAESTEDMVGGYTGKVKKVTKDDIESAEDVLTKKLISDAESTIKSKISEDEILLDDSVLANVISTSSDVKPETVVESFNQSASVKITALVVNKKDLEEYAKKVISDKIPSDSKLLESSLSIIYESGVSDFTKGTEKISLSVSAKSYNTVNTDELSEMFSKKGESEIKSIVESTYGDKVSLVDVNFWPFWVNSAPSNINRIKTNLSFE